MGLKRCFMLITLLQQYLMKTRFEVEFREPACLMQLIEKLVNHWHGVLGLNY
jgi:hypothetical protein